MKKSRFPRLVQVGICCLAIPLVSYLAIGEKRAQNILQKNSNYVNPRAITTQTLATPTVSKEEPPSRPDSPTKKDPENENSKVVPSQPLRQSLQVLTGEDSPQPSVSKKLNSPPLQAVIQEKVSGRVFVGYKSLAVHSAHAGVKRDRSSTQLLVTFYSSGIRKPIFRLSAVLRGSTRGCSAQRLQGYRFDLGMSAFGIKSAKPYLSFERDGDDIIRGESLELMCDREVSKWVRGSLRGKQAVLLGGQRQPITWDIEFAEKLKE